MRQIENKIMEMFYEYPERAFTVREISKLTKIPRATVHKRITALKRQGLITKETKAADSLLFKIKKINYFTGEIIKSGLVDYLTEKLNPSCIILFGSFRKGDSAKESDIDFFVESNIKKEINLKKFEKKLKHKIQLFLENNIHNLPPHLFNNVVNGIKIYGSFKIK